MKQQVKVNFIVALVLLLGYLLYLFFAYNALSKKMGSFGADIQFVASFAPALCIAMDRATELEQLRPRLTALSNDLQQIDNQSGPLGRLEMACAIFCRHYPRMEAPLQKIIPMLDSMETVFQNSVAMNQTSKEVKDEWLNRISELANMAKSVASAGEHCKNGSDFALAAKMVTISMNLSKVKKHIALLDSLSNGGIDEYPYYRHLASRLDAARQQLELTQQLYPFIPSKWVRWMAFYRFSKYEKQYPVCQKLKKWVGNRLENPLNPPNH